jgi:hypothetical protein
MTYPALHLELARGGDLAVSLFGSGEAFTLDFGDAIAEVSWRAVGVPASVLFDREAIIDVDGYHGGRGVTEPQ